MVSRRQHPAANDRAAELGSLASTRRTDSIAGIRTPGSYNPLVPQLRRLQSSSITPTCQNSARRPRNLRADSSGWEGNLGWQDWHHQNQLQKYRAELEGATRR